MLGAINLAEFVKDKQFQYQKLEEAVATAVVGLNEVLDEGLPLHPLEAQRQSVADWRQIGLGVMGVADMLIKMEIPYGSPLSLLICENIIKTILHSAFVKSVQLGNEHGSFPKFNKEAIDNSDFYKANLSYVLYDSLRNSQLLTIAPTGSISTMLGVSGGLEPIYANSYTRTTKTLHGEEKEYKIYTPIVQNYINTHNLDLTTTELPPHFVTAKDVNYLERLQMQAVWQSHIDASISSTVNVPEEFTVENIFDLYISAYNLGLKGVTIFREGCSREGILKTKENPKELVALEGNTTERGEILKVTNDVVGKKRTLQTGCGTLHCMAFFDKTTGNLMETYLSKGSTGGCNNFMIGLSRMVSLAARGGVSIENIVDQLNSCGTCPSYLVKTATQKNTSKGSSCPVAVGHALLSMHQEIQKELIEAHEETTTITYTTAGTPCPICEAELIYEGGCNSCKFCGFSKCD